MKALVTGGAGFIGSHLVDALMERGYHVIVLDNLSSGRLNNIGRWFDSRNFKFFRVDLRLFSDVLNVIRDEEIDVIFHLAANPSVRIGERTPGELFEDNVITTYSVLELARLKDVKAVIFTSSSTVYGDAKVLPTGEECVLEPISVYGATKVAGEAMVSAYAYTFGLKGLSLRLANIVGSRCHHGVIYDFIMKLSKNAKELEILGDGTQKKSYLHVSDCIRAILMTTEVHLKSNRIYDVFNVGNDDWITVKEIADIISKVMGLKEVTYRFTGGVDGGRGWRGDVKFMLLSTEKLKRLGWRPRLSSRKAVELAAIELVKELGVHRSVKSRPSRTHCLL